MQGVERHHGELGPATGRSPAPSLHQRILDDLQENIVSGRWPPGHKVPSEQALTETYGCSRMTVNKVLTQLARAGLVLRRRKVGSIVTARDTQSAILKIYDIGDEVRALDQSYRFELLERTLRLPTKAELLSAALPSRRRVVALRVMHLADERPFCLEERIINLSIVPEAADEAFVALSPGPWLLQHVPWNAAEHRISAATASADAALALNIAAAAPVLVVDRQTWRLDETITRVRLTYPGSRHSLTARFTPLQRPLSPADRS